LKTTVFNNLGLEKTRAHTLQSKVCHTDYSLTLLSCHGPYVLRSARFQ